MKSNRSIDDTYSWHMKSNDLLMILNPDIWNQIGLLMILNPEIWNQIGPMVILNPDIWNQIGLLMMLNLKNEIK